MGLRLGVLLLAFTAFAVGPILQPRHLGFSADASKSAVGSRNAISARTRVCCQLFSNKKNTLLEILHHLMISHFERTGNTKKPPSKFHTIFSFHAISSL